MKVRAWLLANVLGGEHSAPNPFAFAFVALNWKDFVALPLSWKEYWPIALQPPGQYERYFEPEMYVGFCEPIVVAKD